MKMTEFFRRLRLALPVLILAAVPAVAAESTVPKLVSLSPALTELVWQLGCGGAMVGRSTACDWPEAVRKLPAVGDFANPSLERVAASGARLLISDTFQDVAVRRSVERLGVEVLELPLRSLADYRAAVVRLGARLHAEAAAAAELERFDRTVAAARRAAAARKRRPRVLFLVWHDPAMSPGRDSFLTELIELAGGRSIGAAVPRDYFRCAAEWILAENPDGIVYPGMGDAGGLPAWWREVPAVRDGRFFRPRPAGPFLRLSPRFGEALAALRSVVQTLSGPERGEPAAERAVKAGGPANR